MFEEYIEKTKENKKELEEIYNNSLKNIKDEYGEDSTQYKEKNSEKDEALGKLDKGISDAESKLKDNLEGMKGITHNSIGEMLTEIAEYSEKIMTGVNSIFEGIGSVLSYELENAQAKYQAISEKHAELTEKVEESNNRIKQLNEEAKTSQGGRLAVIQEQLSREMDANKELANEEKRLADEKKKAQEQVDKAERKKKRAEMAQQIVQATANIALGVSKAWGQGGPILGPILAALVAAAGAVQIGVMSRQLAKMEDGGLLNGKRHAQGGMRIHGSNIEVEGGEYVINRISTQKNLGLVNYINSQRRQLAPSDLNAYFNNSSPYAESPNFKTMFASGGQLPTQDALDTYHTDRLVQAIQSINMQPVVSVVDIAHVQQNLVQVSDWTNT
jgi:hypothetical protein